jgi:hypothetical protein
LGCWFLLMTIFLLLDHSEPSSHHTTLQTQRLKTKTRPYNENRFKQIYMAYGYTTIKSQSYTYFNTPSTTYVLPTNICSRTFLAICKSTEIIRVSYFIFPLSDENNMFVQLSF